MHDGRVYLLQVSEKECFLTALDAKTGADVWRVPRNGSMLVSASTLGTRRTPIAKSVPSLGRADIASELNTVKPGSVTWIAFDTLPLARSIW